MGVEVCTRDAAVDVVLASALVSEREKNMWLAYLVRTARGVDSGFSHSVVKKYRRLSREVGIALGPEVLDGPKVARLDWDSGRAVMGRAA